MKSSTKAVLLSALLLPGAGHIFLKKYIIGVGLVTLSFALIIYIVTDAVNKALNIVSSIENGNLQMDVEKITELVARQSSETDTQLLSYMMAAIVICWIVGVVDSYRLGRIKDKSEGA